MSNTELNKNLALAIGYLPEHVIKLDSGEVIVYRESLLSDSDQLSRGWDTFDFEDPLTILPIMEAVEIFPMRSSNLNRSDLWEFRFFQPSGGDWIIISDPSPRRVVALATVAKHLDHSNFND